MRRKSNWGFIYVFEIDNRKYIGWTINLKKRFKEHFNEKRSNPDFHNTLRECFISGTFKIIECYRRSQEIDKMLPQREIFWIDKLNTYDTKQIIGWNLTRGGDSNLGYIHTKESRKKMSIRRKGTKNPEHSIRMKGINNPMFGKERPEHSKRMTAQGNPNYGKRSKETSMFGKPSAMKGKHHTEEAKQKIRTYQLLRNNRELKEYELFLLQHI